MAHDKAEGAEEERPESIVVGEVEEEEAELVLIGIDDEALILAIVFVS